MKKELVKLANHLDRLGHTDLADDITSILKMAQTTSPLRTIASAHGIGGDWISLGEGIINSASWKNDQGAIMEWIVNFIALASVMKAVNITQLGGDPKSVAVYNLVAQQPYGGTLKAIRLGDTITSPIDAIDEIIRLTRGSPELRDQAIRGARSAVSRSVPAERSGASSGTKPAATTTTSAKVNHAAGTVLKDSWGTYVVEGPDKVVATSSKDPSKKVVITPSYSGWGTTVSALNKLTPVQKTQDTQTPAATPAATSPATPAATPTGPASTVATPPATTSGETGVGTGTTGPSTGATGEGVDVVSVLENAGVKQSLVDKVMRMLARGLLGEFSKINPRTIAGQQEKVKKLLVQRTRGEITEQEAAEIVAAMSSVAAQKFSPTQASIKTDSLVKGASLVELLSEEISPLARDFSRFTGSVRR